MITLEQRSLSEGLILEKNINKVSVRVQGTAAYIGELTEADIMVYVDLYGLVAGRYELGVMTELTHTENVQVISCYPASVEVELKDTKAQMFPLGVEVLGEPSAGFKQMDVVVAPNEVKLTGAQDYMQRVGKVYVAADISGIDEDGYDKNLSILVLDQIGNNITSMFSLEPKVARVVVPVVSEQPQRLVAVRVPLVGQAAIGYQVALISSTPSVANVFGDLKRLQSLDYVDTEPVDLSDLNADTSLTVRLAPLNGFTVYPKEVTVALSIEPVNQATISKSIILIQNLAENCTAELEQITISMMVYGPETFIANLDEADIVPYVDCQGLSGGEYELPVYVSLPPNVLLLNVSHNTVAITIIAPEGEEDDGAPIDD